MEKLQSILKDSKASKYSSKNNKKIVTVSYILSKISILCFLNLETKVLLSAVSRKKIAVKLNIHRFEVIEFNASANLLSSHDNIF